MTEKQNNFDHLCDPEIVPAEFVKRQSEIMEKQINLWEKVICKHSPGSLRLNIEGLLKYFPYCPDKMKYAHKGI